MIQSWPGWEDMNILHRPTPPPGTCRALSQTFSMFFFQEEDGIRDWSVTGVQTCALPISHVCFPSRRRHTRLVSDWSSDVCFFFSSRRRHTRLVSDWSSDVCSSDLSRRRHTRLVSDWSSDVCSSDRSEEHTSELQSLTNSYAVFCLRSEEHTSELQSLTNLVCRLLLEKKHLTSELQGVTRYPIFLISFFYNVNLPCFNHLDISAILFVFFKKTAATRIFPLPPPRPSSA